MRGFRDQLLLVLVTAACAGADGIGPEDDDPTGTADVDKSDNADVESGRPLLAEPFPFDPFAGPPAALFDCTNPQIPLAHYAVAPVTCIQELACTTPLVVGHRGVGGEFARIAPENSLAGIRAALWMGLDGVELDVRHTADNVIVLMHDDTVDRTTVGTGTVSEMTAAEVTALQLMDLPEFARQGYSGQFDCETVPTLAEALALIENRMFVDLDTKTAEVEHVVAAINAAGARDWVYVSVSDPQRAAQARAIDSDIRIQVRPDTVDELNEVLALFNERPPEIIEIPANRIEAMTLIINEAGSKIFVDVFGEDAVARLVSADESNYIKYFESGSHVVQSEFPGVVLQELGRNLSSIGLSGD